MSRVEVHHASLGDAPTGCEASIPAPTPEHAERIRALIAQDGLEIIDEERGRWTFRGPSKPFFSRCKALDGAEPWWGSGDAWGIWSNLAERTRLIGVGSGCWVLSETPRMVSVLAQDNSSGRWVRAKLRRERIGERRASWLPPELRERVPGWKTEEEAEATTNRLRAPERRW